MKKLLTFVSMVAVALSSWALNVGDTFNSSNGDYTYEVKVAATSSSAGKIAVKSYNNTTATSSKIALSLVAPDGYIYNITNIGAKAYFGRSNITNITIGSNVVDIGFEAFGGTNIKTLEIPSAVTYINIGFARNCEKLEKITVDEWNKKFASYDGALYTKDLTKLHTMPAAKKVAVYPSQLTTIGSYAFANSKMETIDIPYGVTSLDMLPFFYINSKAVVIPSSVKDFYVANDGSGPFWGRANLDEVDVYLNTTSVPMDNAEEFATSALRQYINLHVRRELASEFKSKWSGFKSINVDQRVGFDLSIGKLDFSINSTEPSTINGAKYDGRASLVPGINYGNVSGENNIPFVLSIRGKYYAVTQIADLTFSHSNATKFTGGENIDSVGYSSFNDCKNLTSVSLPNLSFIRQYAFKECSSLTSFAFNKNLKKIEIDAFFDSGLTGDVVLPYGFESLGARAFSGTKVKRLFVPQIKYYNKEMFKGMSSLTDLYLNINISENSNMDFTGVPSTCSLRVAYEYIDSYKANPVWNNAFKTITSGACDFTYGSSTSNAFSSPYRITVLSNTPFTEDGVEYAGTAMYVNYPGMGNMTKFMASSRELNQFYGADKRYKMTGIGDHCFEGATNMVDPGIAQMTFLEQIGEGAFTNSGVTNITVPPTVKKIGNKAFAGATNLQELTVLPGLKNLTLGGQLYGNNASDFHCYVSNNDIAAYYRMAREWKSGLENNLNAFVKPEHKTMLLGVCVPVDFLASGVNAYACHDIDAYGTTVYTLKMNTLQQGKAAILTDLTPGNVYKLKRPAGTADTPVFSCLVANSTEGDYALMPSSGYYEWSEASECFVKPEYKTYISSGSAYYAPLNHPGGDKLYLDIFQGGDFKKGDVNGDGEVDVTDANILTNIILGKDSASNYGGRADVDDNGEVDVTDANLVTNIILGK